MPFLSLLFWLDSLVWRSWPFSFWFVGRRPSDLAFTFSPTPCCVRSVPFCPLLVSVVARAPLAWLLALRQLSYAFTWDGSSVVYPDWWHAVFASLVFSGVQAGFEEFVFRGLSLFSGGWRGTSLCLLGSASHWQFCWGTCESRAALGLWAPFWVKRLPLACSACRFVGGKPARWGQRLSLFT